METVWKTLQQGGWVLLQITFVVSKVKTLGFYSVYVCAACPAKLQGVIDVTKMFTKCAMYTNFNT